MSFSVNPNTFKTMDIDTQKGQNVFLHQLATLLTQMVAAFNSVSGSSLTVTDKALGTVSTNQTVNCANACFVMVSLTISAAITLTLSNLQVGIPVFVRCAFTGSFVIKMAGTTPGGTAYSIFAIPTTGSTVNMVSAGVTGASGITASFNGNSVTEGSTPTLYMALVG